VRLFDRLDELYAIGGGTRLAYTPEEDEAHELAAEWMREAALTVDRDEAGNLFGRRGEARVWSGSHLDTVPNGGKFDGALGVVAAVEAAERLRDLPLAVVAFRAEESGPMGSRRLTELPQAFLEVHIEQGPTLERLGAPLGIVTAIAGQARGSVTFEGRACHAGTTPMDERSDALVQAAEFVLRVRDSARDGAVATVGALEVEDGAMNVVPGRVAVSVDARAPTGEQLEGLISAIGFAPAWRQDPVAMSGSPLEALRTVLPAAPELVSGAGHDAMVLAAAGVPTAMLFVRSLNGGVSHCPDELSAEEDIALAVDVLDTALRRVVSAVDE
jgi:acetylornithine deacetylase/succinyl-diaminopimelate desuccinylase-like protein